MQDFDSSSNVALKEHFKGDTTSVMLSAGQDSTKVSKIVRSVKEVFC